MGWGYGDEEREGFGEWGVVMEMRGVLEAKHRMMCMYSRVVLNVFFFIIPRNTH